MDELADGMLIVESRLDAQGDLIRNDQRVVEIETAERIAARLQRWGRMLGVWVGLPIAFVMIGLTFLVGRSFVDLADLAATSRRAIEGVLQKAHSEADDAKRNADHALHESAQLEEGIKQLQSSLSVSQARLSQQSDQMQQLKQNIEAVRSEKNAASLIDIYPGLFGQHVVGTRTGYIDVSRKKPTDIYLTLAVGAQNMSTALTAPAVGNAITLLEREGITVFVGGVSMWATSGRSSQGVDSMAEDSCAMASIKPPCVLYFRPDLRERVLKLRLLIGSAQAISEDRFRYVQPENLSSIKRELLSRSGWTSSLFWEQAKIETFRPQVRSWRR